MKCVWFRVLDRSVLKLVFEKQKNENNSYAYPKTIVLEINKNAVAYGHMVNKYIY